MGRVVLRILQIALSAARGLLVVPTAVTIGTGGQAPGWLRPYPGRPCPKEPDLAARRQILFDAYVAGVLARRRSHERGAPAAVSAGR